MALITSHWYYNTESGELTNGNNIENLANNLFGGLGWHELNISGSATETQAAAEAKKEFPTGKAPTTSIATGVANAAPDVANSIPGLSQIGDFFSALAQKNTWIRVLKVVVGGTLVIVGLAHMTGASNAVAETARKIPIIV